jgi:hypothetical protein
MLVVLILLVLYLGIGLMLYFFQEGLLFFPQKLPKTYSFSFDEPFEEMEILTESDVLLHGLLFQTENTKGLIFYLHGNAGALDSWARWRQLIPHWGTMSFYWTILDMERVKEKFRVRHSCSKQFRTLTMKSKSVIKRIKSLF